tara:strand:+ start:1812 stop:3038 length:1227 start_codon:yes stop_codon:yes gene_type:complete
MKKVFLTLIIFSLYHSTQSQTQSEFFSGYIKTPEEVLDSLPVLEFIPKGFYQAPKKWDLSANLPIPGNQGKQGSCVSWTLGYALKSYQERIEEQNQNLVFSPSYIYNQVLHRTEPCSKGIKFEKAFTFLEQNGCAEYRDFPYDENDCRKQPNQTIKDRAERFRILSSQLIFKYKNGGPNIDVNMVKNEVSFGSPIIIGMLLDKEFWNDTYGDRSSSSPYIWDNLNYDCPNCYHAMLVVGYDDDLKAVKVINSYGKTFGNGGYAWISYNVFENTVYEAYTTLDDDNNLFGIVANKEARSSIPDETVGILDEDRKYDNWIKSGYFRYIGNDIKLSLIYLSRKNQEAIFKIYHIENNTEKILGSIKLKPEQSYALYYGDKKYNLKLDRIGRAGFIFNIFNPSAAFYSFTLE